jgi:hypothetical protein
MIAGHEIAVGVAAGLLLSGLTEPIAITPVTGATARPAVSPTSIFGARAWLLQLKMNA